MPHREALYTGPFLLLCLSHALFAASFNMIIPELPAYLSSLGGAEYKGLIIALFTVTAGASRPFSGKLTDTIGRVPVMVFGTLVCVVCSLLYPLLTSVAGFMLLRLVHGFSTGFKPTGTSAFGADIAPAHRRGEAMGILGVSMSVGGSISPPLGSWIATQFSWDAMFVASSAVALLSILILARLRETLPNPQPFRLSLLAVPRREWLDRSAIHPSVVNLLLYICYGVLLTIVPDQSTHVGIENKGLFFSSFTLFSLFSRILAGRASDRYGRLPVILLSFVLLTASLVYMGFVDSPASLLLASGLMGLALGTAAPAIFAWTIDRSAEENRGRALATVYIALEIGIGGGALAGAWIYHNNPELFARTFWITAAVTALAIPYLLAGRGR